MIALLLATAAWSAEGKNKLLRQELRGDMKYVARVLRGVNVRQQTIRDYLTPVFLDVDGRDRFLLNLVARVRRGGIIDARIRRLDWTIAQVDPVYGFAEVSMEACGRWHLWIPRCVDVPLRWRRVEDRWYLLPPEEIRLDPDLS